MKLYISFLYGVMILIWGTSWLGIKLQLGVVAPELSVVYRFVLASLIMWIFAVISRQRIRFSRYNHAMFAIHGFFQFCLNYQFFYLATEYLTSGLVSVALSAIIVLNIFNAALFFGQKISPQALLASMIGLTGLALVFWPELTATQGTVKSWIGLGFSMGGTLCGSLGTMMAMRHGRANISIISSTLWAMTYGALFSATFALAKGTPVTMDWSVQYITALVYLSIFATILAFGIYFYLIKKIGANKTSYATLFFPLVALTISTIFEDYHWPWLAMIGVIMVLAGNITILYKPKQRH